MEIFVKDTLYCSVSKMLMITATISTLRSVPYSQYQQQFSLESIIFLLSVDRCSDFINNISYIHSITSRSLTRGRESTGTVINEVKSNELESRIGAWTDIPYRSGHAPKHPARQAPRNRIVATRRGYNEHIGPESVGPRQSL